MFVFIHSWYFSFFLIASCEKILTLPKLAYGDYTMQFTTILLKIKHNTSLVEVTAVLTSIYLVIIKL